MTSSSADTSMQPSPSEQTLPRLLEGVVTLRIVSRGAYGTVYLGRDSAHRSLAVKAVGSQLPTFAQERERRGLECYLEKFQNGGEHLLAVHQISPAGEPLRYSMELADNLNDPNSTDNYQAASLAAWMERHGSQPIAVIVDWVHQLLDGVEALHQAGLLHRDLKPANLYFVHGCLKLGDFGLVTKQAPENTLIGTREYIPDGLEFASPEMDLYALGKILYHIATGLPVAEYPRIPGTLVGDAALAELNRFLLDRACSNDSAKRFHSADAFRTAFDEVCNPATQARRRQYRRRRLLIGAQIAFVAMLLIALGVALFRGGEESRGIPRGYEPVQQSWHERIIPTDEGMRLRFAEPLDENHAEITDDGKGVRAAWNSESRRIPDAAFELYFEATSDSRRAKLDISFLKEDGTPSGGVSCLVTPRGVFSETTVIDGMPNGARTWGIRILPVAGRLMLLANGRSVLDVAPLEGLPPWKIVLNLTSEEGAELALRKLCCFGR